MENIEIFNFFIALFVLSSDCQRCNKRKIYIIGFVVVEWKISFRFTTNTHTIYNIFMYLERDMETTISTPQGKGVGKICKNRSKLL